MYTNMQLTQVTVLFCQYCGSEDWFNWRVYAPDATDEMVELDSMELRNCHSQSLANIPATITIQTGVSTKNSFTHTEEITVEAGLEIKMAFKASPKVTYKQVFETMDVTQKSESYTYTIGGTSGVPLEPGQRLVVSQVIGKYGPYTIKTRKYDTSVLACE